MDKRHEPISKAAFTAPIVLSRVNPAGSGAFLRSVGRRFLRGQHSLQPVPKLLHRLLRLVGADVGKGHGFVVGTASRLLHVCGTSRPVSAV